MPPFPQIDDVDLFLDCMEAASSDSGGDCDDISEADLALDDIDDFSLEQLEEPAATSMEALGELDASEVPPVPPLQPVDTAMELMEAPGMDVDSKVDSHFEAMDTGGGV